MDLIQPLIFLVALIGAFLAGRLTARPDIEIREVPIEVRVAASDLSPRRTGGDFRRVLFLPEGETYRMRTDSLGLETLKPRGDGSWYTQQSLDDTVAIYVKKHG